MSPLYVCVITISNTTTKPTTASTTPLIAAMNNGKKKLHDRWIEYENFLTEFKIARGSLPTISDAVQALQKKHPLASENEWERVARRYEVEKKGDKEFCTTKLTDDTLGMVCKTLQNGRIHSIFRMHPEMVRSYAKKHDITLPQNDKKKNSEK